MGLTETKTKDALKGFEDSDYAIETLSFGVSLAPQSYPMWVLGGIYFVMSRRLTQIQKLQD
jgi:hypothetical protein